MLPCILWSSSTSASDFTTLNMLMPSYGFCFCMFICRSRVNMTRGGGFMSFGIDFVV